MAARTVASCRSSFDPNSAKTPLLLSPRSAASRPTVSPSRPSTEATETARASTSRRVSSPRATRPSVRVPALPVVVMGSLQCVTGPLRPAYATDRTTVLFVGRAGECGAGQER